MFFFLLPVQKPRKLRLVNIHGCTCGDRANTQAQRTYDNSFVTLSERRPTKFPSDWILWHQEQVRRWTNTGPLFCSGVEVSVASILLFVWSSAYKKSVLQLCLCKRHPAWGGHSNFCLGTCYILNNVVHSLVLEQPSWKWSQVVSDHSHMCWECIRYRENGMPVVQVNLLIR